MGTKKKALIITDGSRGIRAAALLIKQSLEGYRVKIINAKKFLGNELLPVDFFFIGSKKAKPKSFAGMVEFLSHVNLASRKCSIYGANEKTIKYLSGIIADSEVECGEPLILPEEVTETVIKNWLKKIIN